MANTEPSLAEQLATYTEPENYHAKKAFIDKHFGDQPEVLDEIRRMRSVGFTYVRISEILTNHSGLDVTTWAVSRWLKEDAKRG